MKMITQIKIRKKKQMIHQNKKSWGGWKDGGCDTWQNKWKVAYSDEAAHQGVMTDFQARL